MQENNPYAAPSSNLGGGDSYGENHNGVTPGVVAELVGTKGWTRFVGVLVILCSLVFLVGVAFLAREMSQLERLFSRMVNMPGDVSSMGKVLLVIAGVIIALMLTYGLMLNGFSSSVNKLVQNTTEKELFETLRRQRNFWIFWGILSILTTFFTVLGNLS